MQMELNLAFIAEQLGYDEAVTTFEDTAADRKAAFNAVLYDAASGVPHNLLSFGPCAPSHPSAEVPRSAPTNSSISVTYQLLLDTLRCGSPLSKQAPH